MNGADGEKPALGAQLKGLPCVLESVVFFLQVCYRNPSHLSSVDRHVDVTESYAKENSLCQNHPCLKTK